MSYINNRRLGNQFNKLIIGTNSAEVPSLMRNTYLSGLKDELEVNFYELSPMNVNLIEICGCSVINQELKGGKLDIVMTYDINEYKDKTRRGMPGHFDTNCALVTNEGEKLSGFFSISNDVSNITILGQQGLLNIAEVEVVFHYTSMSHFSSDSDEKYTNDIKIVFNYV